MHRAAPRAPCTPWARGWRVSIPAVSFSEASRRPAHSGPSARCSRPSASKGRVCFGCMTSAGATQKTCRSRALRWPRYLLLESGDHALSWRISIATLWKGMRSWRRTCSSLIQTKRRWPAPPCLAPVHGCVRAPAPVLCPRAFGSGCARVTGPCRLRAAWHWVLRAGVARGRPSGGASGLGPSRPPRGGGLAPRCTHRRRQQSGSRPCTRGSICGRPTAVAEAAVGADAHRCGQAQIGLGCA